MDIAGRCSHAIVQLHTASQPGVRNCTIVCEHRPAISIHRFLHKWQVNLHEQFDRRVLRTTKGKVSKPIVLQLLLANKLLHDGKR